MKFIILRLEGPIQSWGERSYWDEKDTANIPTKSGVIGLIATCLGLKRDDLKIQEIYDKTTLSIRVDDRGRILRDYQTIENTMRADGKINENMIVSPRFYLTEASFLCALSVSEEQLFKLIEEKLKCPEWTPYLGRKCCVPSVPIYVGTIEAKDAKRALSDNRFPIRYYNEPAEYIELNIEGKAPDSKQTYKKRDVYGIKRFFRYRNVYEDNVPFKTLSSINLLKEGEDVSIVN